MTTSSRKAVLVDETTGRVPKRLLDSSLVDTTALGVETTRAETAEAAALQRANHTGTQSADTIVDGGTNKAYTSAEKTKLAGIATGATANRSDSATDTAISTAITAVVGAAPDALNTLKEIDDQIAADEGSAAALAAAVALRAPIASPALTGSPTAPTAATTDSSTVIATTALVAAKIATQATVDAAAQGRGGARLYVSLDGNDSGAGTSWATAKRTVAAAVAALPTFTSLGVTYHAGTVEIGVGTFVEQGNIEANTEIRFVGANAMSGQQGTWIQLAAGRNVDVFRYQAAWGAAGGFAHGLAFENMTIDGNASGQGATTLSAAISSTTATTLSVTANAAFPQSGAFDVAIDSEIVSVTAGAGTNTWTITRGQYGTVAATHSSGAAVNFAGACVRIFGGGFNCKTDNTHFRNAGIGLRIDGAAVNYVGHDFNASGMYGPAFAYLPASWASGCMIAFSGTGQIDDCGHDAMFFQGSQNGTLAVNIAGIKFESNVSTVKHQHCIAYKSTLDSGSSPSFVIDGISAYALGGGREAVIYDYANSNGQGAAWNLNAIVGEDGYIEGFYSARYGIHTGSPGISSLFVANSGNSGGGPALGAVHLGTAKFYSSPYAATPNGQITAYQGALYEYTGGGVPALWMKTTDGGNTGWLPVQAVASGAGTSRPTGVPSGWQFFDTDLGKPVWKSGTSWVDATGTAAPVSRDPSKITGLVARYRAGALTGLTDGGSVSSWADTSGSGYTATTTSGGAAPTYRASSIGGKPAVRFDGSSQSLDSALPAGLSAQTIILIASLTTSVVGTVRGTVGANSFMLRSYNGTPQTLVQETANIGTATSAVSNATASVIIATYDSVSGAYTFTINGNAAGTGTAVQTLAAATSRIGKNGAAGKTDWFAGDIAELLVWNRVLTPTERSTVDSYVQDTYGISVIDYIPAP